MLKVLTKGCEPTKGSKYSACIDLYASETVTIGAGETKVIGLGVAIDEDTINSLNTMNLRIEEELYPHLSISADPSFFMESHVLKIYMRSSTASKKGLIMPNGVGIIDLDYRDEIKIILHNPLNENSYDCDMSCIINKGDKIAQIELCEHKTYLLGVETDKQRIGGLGSTGN